MFSKIPFSTYDSNAQPCTDQANHSNQPRPTGSADRVIQGADSDNWVSPLVSNSKSSNPSREAPNVSRSTFGGSSLFGVTGRDSTPGFGEDISGLKQTDNKPGGGMFGSLLAKGPAESLIGGKGGNFEGGFGALAAANAKTHVDKPTGIGGFGFLAGPGPGSILDSNNSFGTSSVFSTASTTSFRPGTAVQSVPAGFDFGDVGGLTGEAKDEHIFSTDRNDQYGSLIGVIDASPNLRQTGASNSYQNTNAGFASVIGSGSKGSDSGPSPLKMRDRLSKPSATKDASAPELFSKVANQPEWLGPAGEKISSTATSFLTNFGPKPQGFETSGSALKNSIFGQSKSTIRKATPSSKLNEGGSSLLVSRALKDILSSSSTSSGSASSLPKPNMAIASSKTIIGKPPTFNTIAPFYHPSTSSAAVHSSSIPNLMDVDLSKPPPARATSRFNTSIANPHQRETELKVSQSEMFVEEQDWASNSTDIVFESPPPPRVEIASLLANQSNIIDQSLYNAVMGNSTKDSLPGRGVDGSNDADKSIEKYLKSVIEHAGDPNFPISPVSSAKSGKYRTPKKPANAGRKLTSKFAESGISGLANKFLPRIKLRDNPNAKGRTDESSSKSTRFPSADSDRKHNLPAGKQNSSNSSKTKKPILTAEQLKECVRLKVRSIPAKCNNRTYLAHHFKVYRNLKSIYCNPVDGTAVVEYTTHDSAAKAKRAGLNFRPGTAPVKIDWILPKTVVEKFPDLKSSITPATTPMKQLFSPGSPVALPKPPPLQQPTATPRSTKKPSPLLKKVLKRQFRENKRNNRRNDKKFGATRLLPGANPESQEGDISDYKMETTNDEMGRELGESSQFPELSNQKHDQLVSTEPFADNSTVDSLEMDVSRSGGSPELPDHHEAGDLENAEQESGDGYAGNYLDLRDAPQSIGAAHVNLAEHLLPARISKRRLTKSQQETIGALSVLIRQSAHTVEERKNILEERDKIMRRAKGFMKMGVGLGTCPDMCPEKERYVRAYQRLVDPYEATENRMGINPYRAVKDYSRSSADQEQPLSHDLRPGDVLDRTMTYLLREIVGVAGPAATASLPGWFDFLWKRTRAIRKDLTQQKLCDKTAVELFEKCTRLHIFAGYWMCELDSSDFDQSINTENLIKCLQSLRHLYEDLAKKGIACENESEFRCYQILLNLKDSNVLVQALSWSQRVRQSVDVKTTIKCMNAFQSRNCVRFFRIVERKFTFLQACLAHRYFAESRALALEAMCRAYTTPPYVPTDYLCRILAFDSESELIEFCAAHEISEGSKDDRSIIYLNNKAFEFPSVQPKLKKCEILIEMKVKCPLFEVLNGGRLKEFPSYNPVDSFNEHGRFNCDPVTLQFLEDLLSIADSTEQMEDSIEDSDVNLEASESKSFSPDSFVLPGGFNQKTSSENKREEFALLTVMTIMKQVCEEESKKAALSAYSEIVFEDLFDLFLDGWVKSIARSEYDQSFKRLEELNKTTNRALDWIVDSCLPEFIFETSVAVWRSEFERSTDLAVASIGNRMLQETVGDLIASILQEFYQENVTNVLKRLDDIRQRLIDAKTRTVLRFWRQKACRQYRQRMLVSSFPAAPGRSSSSLIGSLRKRSLPKDAKQVSPENMKRAMKSLHLEQDAIRARHDLAWRMIDWRVPELTRVLSTNSIGCLIRDGHRQHCILRIAFISKGGVSPLISWMRNKFGFEENDVSKACFSLRHDTEITMISGWFDGGTSGSSVREWRKRVFPQMLSYDALVIIDEEDPFVQQSDDYAELLSGQNGGNARPLLLVTNSDIDRTLELESLPGCSHVAQVTVDDRNLDDVDNTKMLLAGLANVLPHCGLKDVTVVEASTLLSDCVVLLESAAMVEASFQFYRDAFESILALCETNVTNIDSQLSNTDLDLQFCPIGDFANTINTACDQLSLAIEDQDSASLDARQLVNDALVAMRKDRHICLHSHALREVEETLVKLAADRCIRQCDLHQSKLSASKDNNCDNDDGSNAESNTRCNDNTLEGCKDLLSQLNESIGREKSAWASEEADWLMLLEDDLFS